MLSVGCVSAVIPTLVVLKGIVTDFQGPLIETFQFSWGVYVVVVVWFVALVASWLFWWHLPDPPKTVAFERAYMEAINQRVREDIESTKELEQRLMEGTKRIKQEAIGKVPFVDIPAKDLPHWRIMSARAMAEGIKRAQEERARKQQGDIKGGAEAPPNTR